MFRDNKPPLNKTVINVTLSDGGLGDILCYLVTVDYIVKNLPHIIANVWVPDYLFDFAKNVLPKETRLGDYTKALKHYNNKLVGVSTRWLGQHTPMRIHPVDYSNHMLIDCDLPIEKKNYLKFDNSEIPLEQFNLPNKYVSISVGSTAKTKELSPELLNQIIDYVIKKGYTPVFLGKAETNAGAGPKMTANLAQVDYLKGIDLTNKTSLVETASVISKGKAFIGSEGGLTHLAGFTDVPIVSSYTFVDPSIMMPIRNNQVGNGVYPVVPEASLGCRYCQSNMALLYGHNFQECFYGPNDYTCIKQLTLNKWQEQIDKVI